MESKVTEHTIHIFCSMFCVCLICIIWTGPVVWSNYVPNSCPTSHNFNDCF